MQQILQIDPSTMIKTSDGPKSYQQLVDSAELCLWAVPWVQQGNHDGITFHCKYNAARRYVDYYIKTHPGADFNVSRPNDKPRLVPVSQWLYDYVEENGDFWTPLNYLHEATSYQPTFH